MSLFLAVFSIFVASTVSSPVELARSCSDAVCEFTYDGPRVYTFSFNVPVVRIQLPDRFDGAYLNITLLSTIETVEYHGKGNITCDSIISQHTITLMLGKNHTTCTYGTTPKTKILPTTSLRTTMRLGTTTGSVTRHSSTGPSTHPTLTHTSSSRSSSIRPPSIHPSSSHQSSVRPSSIRPSSTHHSSLSHSLDEFTVSTISLSIIVGGCLVLIVVFLILHYFKILKIKHIRLGNLSLEMSSVGLTRQRSEPNISNISATPDRHRSLPNLSTTSSSTPTGPATSQAISTISLSPVSPPVPLPPHRYPTRHQKRNMF